MPHQVMPWWRVGVLAAIGAGTFLIGLWYSTIPAVSDFSVYSRLRSAAPFTVWGALWMAGGAALLAALVAARRLLSPTLGLLGSFQVFWAAMIDASTQHASGAVGATLYLTLAVITWLCASAVSGVR